MLDILGHVYHVQPTLPEAAGTPDYAFFADEAAKNTAAPRLGTAAFWETALAVGDAKRWDRPLDKRILDGAPDAFTNANPCYQITTICGAPAAPGGWSPTGAAGGSTTAIPATGWTSSMRWTWPN